MGGNAKRCLPNGEKILYDIFPIEMVEGAVTSATTTTNNRVSQTNAGVNTSESLQPRTETDDGEKTAVRHKNQNVVKELNDLLLSDDKKRHVPDSMKKAVSEALSMVRMDTIGADGRIAKYEALIADEMAKKNRIRIR